MISSVPKKIPTIAAIIVILSIIGIVSIVVQKTTQTQTSASSSVEPKNVQVTNITDTSATVIWQTDIATTGILLLSSPAKNKITAYDERDITGKMNKYTTHSVSIKNLTENTSYEIYIMSDGKKFPLNNKPYALRTAIASLGETVRLDPAYGMVKKFDGRAAEGALVTFSLENSQTLSTLVRSTGSWMISLNLLRTKDLTSFYTIKETENTTGTLVITLDNQKTESFIDTKTLSPVPDMILGNTYDFRNYQVKKQTNQTLTENKKSETSGKTTNVLGEQTVKTPTPIPTMSKTKIGGIAIIAPAQDASLVSNRPLFQGTGLPEKTITITLGITKPVIAKTVVGKDGNWQFTPSKPLAPGKQSVTITTVDEKGKAVAVTNLFTILKSGTQVLGDATPSATLEPTFTPTPQASATGEPLPEPGTSLPTALLLITGIIFFIGGSIIFTKQ